MALKLRWRMPLSDGGRLNNGRRPSAAGLVIVLIFLFAGVVWIDLYDVPNGLINLACDFRVTDWHGILTSPKFYFAFPILLAELAFVARLLIWLWPNAPLAKTIMSNWAVLVLVFLLSIGLYFYEVAALQPAPWHACLS